MSTDLALPEALSAALSASPDAYTYFQSLPPSHRKEYVSYIEEAKGEDTRRRRAEKTISMLLSKSGK
jgi:uncharacterized protein YdeI (YjbR/CyaY-like superfamily)